MVRMDAPEKRSRRTLLWVSTANFGEGLPWSVLHQMGTEFITDRGGTPTQIGSTSLFHLAVTFKFLWSPLVDLFGTKRGWVLALQVALGGGMMAIAAATTGSAKVLLLDEPFSMLDAPTIDRVRSAIAERIDDEATLILVSAARAF